MSSRFSFGNIIGDPFALSTLSISTVRLTPPPPLANHAEGCIHVVNNTILTDNLARLVNFIRLLYHR